jgi:hypothetical protein
MRTMGRSSLPGIWLYAFRQPSFPPSQGIAEGDSRGPLMPDSQDCLTSANFICADLDSIVFA